MSLRFTVTVTSDSLDDYGDPVASTPRTVTNCYVDPQSSSESHTGYRSSVVTAVALSMPFGSAVTEGDLVTIPAEAGRWAGVWHVIGEPFDWGNPLTGTYFRTVAAIERGK